MTTDPRLKPPPGWPTLDDLEGPYVPRTYQTPRNPHALPAQAPTPDAFMQGADGQPVALYAHPAAQFAPTEAAVPQTFQRDPWPARILATAVAAPAFGWGAAMAFGALAGATTAIGLIVAGLAALYLLKAGGGGGGKVNVKVNVNNNIRTRR